MERRDKSFIGLTPVSDIATPELLVLRHGVSEGLCCAADLSEANSRRPDFQARLPPPAVSAKHPHLGKDATVEELLEGEQDLGVGSHMQAVAMKEQVVVPSVATPACGQSGFLSGNVPQTGPNSAQATTAQATDVEGARRREGSHQKGGKS